MLKMYSELAEDAKHSQWVTGRLPVRRLLPSWHFAVVTTVGFKLLAILKASSLSWPVMHSISSPSRSCYRNMVMECSIRWRVTPLKVLLPLSMCQRYLRLVLLVPFPSLALMVPIKEPLLADSAAEGSGNCMEAVGDLPKVEAFMARNPRYVVTSTCRLDIVVNGTALFTSNTPQFTFPHATIPYRPASNSRCRSDIISSRSTRAPGTTMISLTVCGVACE
ncbi:hypothetical protein LXA43DRAFT_92543 [Ganoderma leucocontextum]|nr:hypothetical protein LXA43DRAFT_92543 [Ganoderma leucocontextum]